MTVFEESRDGRELTERLKNHERRIKQLEKFDAGQQQQTVVTVIAARDQAVAAAEEIALDQKADPGNLFDYAPIIAKDASLFWTARQPTPGTAYYEPAGVPNIVEWFPDGFTVESTQPGLLAIGNRRTFNMGPEVRYNTRFSAALTPTSTPWPDTMFVRLGLWVGPYSWPAVDGPIGIDQPQIGSQFVTPNPGVNGEYYYPDATRAVSWLPGDPDRTTWRPAVTINFTAAGQRMTVRKIRMQVIAGTLDFTGGSTVPGASLVDSSVTPAKLDTDTRTRLAKRGIYSIQNPSSTTANWPQAANGVWTDLPIPTESGVVTTNTINDSAAGTITGGYIVAPFTGLYDVRSVVRFNGNGNGTVRATAYRVDPAGSSSALLQTVKVDRRVANTFPPVAAVSIDSNDILVANAGDRIWVAATHDAGSGVVIPTKLETFRVKYIGT